MMAQSKISERIACLKKQPLEMVAWNTIMTNKLNGLTFFNPLIANDAFRCHKQLYLLEKSIVQMCENHQICRANLGKNPQVFSTPPALKCADGGVHEQPSS